VRIGKSLSLSFVVLVIYLFVTLPFASAQGMQGYFQQDQGRVTIEQIRQGMFAELFGMREEVPNAFAQVSDRPISEFGSYGLLVSVPDSSIDYIHVNNPRTGWEEVYSMEGQTDNVFPIQASPGDEIELTGLVEGSGQESTGFWERIFRDFIPEVETYSVDVPVSSKEGAESLISSAVLSGEVGANVASLLVSGEEGTLQCLQKW